MNQLPGLVASLLVFKQPMCRFSMVRTCSNIEKARTHRLFGFQMTKPHSVLDSSIVLLLQGIQRGSISQWDTHTHTRASHYVIEVDTVLSIAVLVALFGSLVDSEKSNLVELDKILIGFFNDILFGQDQVSSKTNSSWSPCVLQRR